MPSAIDTLTATFNDAFARLGESAQHDRDAVVTSWPSLPVEIVRACRLRLVVATGSRAATPAADAHLEPGVFPGRIRQLVDAALAGRLRHVARIVIPRTSDPDYKCFLYLREFARLGVAGAVAPTTLFDLLQSQGAHVRHYDVERTRSLVEVLADASGHRPSDDELWEEMTLANSARAAARRLAALRLGVPQISGAVVFPLLGARWLVPPRDYASLANQAAEHFENGPFLHGPRVVLAGAPVDGTTLHAAVESRGGVVVDEHSAWSCVEAGAGIRGDGEPLSTLADLYRHQAMGPRLSAATPERALRLLASADAVVVSLPDDDATFGWDYPALRDRLERSRVPHVVLRADPHWPLTPDDARRLDALLEAADRHHASHHG